MGNVGGQKARTRVGVSLRENVLNVNDHIRNDDYSSVLLSLSLPLSLCLCLSLPPPHPPPGLPKHWMTSHSVWTM